MTSKIRTLIIVTAIGLLGLILFGRAFPAAAPSFADAQNLRSTTPLPPIHTATLTQTPHPTPPPLSPPTSPPSSAPSARPTNTPRPTRTLTPRPSHTPRPTATPTPDMTALDARLQADAALQAALCRPDMKLTLNEGDVVLPILLYHFVGRASLEPGGQSNTRYDVTLADFELQLAILYRLGYQTVNMHDVAEAISGTLTLPPRPVVITVDDGWIEQYTNIYPRLKAYRMTATFYIPSTYPVGGRFVTWEQLQEMVEGGMDIGAHTRKHVNLAAQSAETAWYELTDSKKVLEEKLGITVDSLSYPFGSYTSSTLALVEQAGYQTAVALGPGPRHSERTRYRLNRYEVIGTRPLADFLNYLPWRGYGTHLCPHTLPTPTPTLGARRQ